MKKNLLKAKLMVLVIGIGIFATSCSSVNQSKNVQTQSESEIENNGEPKMKEVDVKEPVKFNGSTTTKEDSLNDMYYMKKELERIVSENNLFKFIHDDFIPGNDGNLLGIQIRGDKDSFAEPLKELTIDATPCKYQRDGKESDAYIKKLSLSIDSSEIEKYKYVTELVKTVIGTQFNENIFNSICEEAKKPFIMHGIENIRDVNKEVDGWKYAVTINKKTNKTNIGVEKVFEIK